MSCTPFDPLVDTETWEAPEIPFSLFDVAPPSIRLWILKQQEVAIWRQELRECCTPFDPLVDTETCGIFHQAETKNDVAPPSIRLWILKLEFY